MFLQHCLKCGCSAFPLLRPLPYRLETDHPEVFPICGFKSLPAYTPFDDGQGRGDDVSSAFSSCRLALANFFAKDGTGADFDVYANVNIL
ncbi:hypothetical protein EHI42_12860 [Rhizobium hidalgonense]|nr:hypothetical protein EHI42_12860 [Rhizobium hidalgonense]